ncbi:MAG: hypothetical protein HRF46_11180, partial [Acidobacteriota bacterium]
MHVLTLSSVSVHFPPRREVQRSLKELLIRGLGQRTQQEDVFWALREVDLA